MASITEQAATAQTRADRERISAEWARVGGGFTVTPASYPVDLERLIARSAEQAPADARLFFVAASWLGVHHHLVDARRLARVLAELEGVASATAGAMLTAANEIAHTPRLEAAAQHCVPLSKPRVLFERTAANPVLAEYARREALPVFTRWGLYCNELTLKTAAIRSIRWILQHCPELAVRAVLGASLDGVLVAALLESPSSVAALAREAGATYAATHEAVGRLTARGLLDASGPRTGAWVSLAPGIGRWMAELSAMLARSPDRASESPAHHAHAKGESPSRGVTGDAVGRGGAPETQQRSIRRPASSARAAGNRRRSSTS